MAIRYDKQLNTEIRRTVANFNRKVSRLESQQRELIPNKVYTADLKEQYTSRRELKRKLAELKRFSERGAEDIIKNKEGLKFTKWSYENLKREVRRAKYVGNRELKRLEIKSTPLTITRNASLNKLRSQMKVIGKNIEKINRKELNQITSNVNRVLDYDKRSETFRENYIQMLFTEYGKSNVSEEVIDTITDFISNLTSEELVRLNKVSPEIQKIVEISPSPPFTVYVSQKATGDALKSLAEKIKDGSLIGLL